MVAVEDTEGMGISLMNILSAAQCRAKEHVGHSRIPSDLNAVNMQKVEQNLFICWMRVLLPCFICFFVR